MFLLIPFASFIHSFLPCSVLFCVTAAAYFALTKLYKPKSVMDSHFIPFEKDNHLFSSYALLYLSLIFIHFSWEKARFTMEYYFICMSSTTVHIVLSLLSMCLFRLFHLSNLLLGTETRCI